ncbi:hypothetical protein MZD04_gp241 [Pseudomonas phage Psa21]|uniref:Uncharacterized protein n=1 Tax=Pseudomonas phage Psa21 TaxID=2530023 RepID=A0A481W6D3_9CAUD|nr:hypothetical protein MZD04_gp241 [Pseudomonas phage Psa21]QBJ02767.1 hypothetical protein PSA21_241 [Pseudomonas phage Psa21]
MISRMEILNAATNGDSAKEKIYDTICESWYLSDEDDDTKALKKFKADLAKVEKDIANIKK